MSRTGRLLPDGRGAVLLRIALLLATATGLAQPRPRVVLVTIDAASDAIVDDLLARGVLKPDGAFGLMSARGTRAEALIPVNAASTPIVHAALYSGVAPARNGIVGISMPLTGADIRAAADVPNGFSLPTDRDRIWSIVAKQGKHVVCINAPGAGAARQDDSCTFTMAFPATFSDGVVADATSSTITLQTRGGKQITLAVSRKGNHRYRVSESSSKTACLVAPDRRCTLAFEVDGARLWTQIQLLQGEQERIYASALIGQATNDTNRLTHIQKAIGYSSLGGDSRLSTLGVIPDDLWRAENNRLADYGAAAVLHALKRQDWDLMVTYLPLVDQTEHRYLLIDPRQPDYNSEGGARRERYRRYVEEAYQRIDAILLNWMNAAPAGTSFIVVSDHGMVPTHSTVRVMNLLAAAGLHATERGETDVWARSNGGSAHVYVNAKGRFAGGTVAAADVETVTARVIEALQEFRDAQTGEKVFPLVRRHNELAELGLDHPRTGDVFVSAAEGYSLSTRYLEGGSVVVGNTFQPDTRARIAKSEADRRFLESGTANETGLGVHGQVAGARSLDAIFYASGGNVPRRALDKVNDVDVLPSVLELLGLQAPAGLEGRSVWR